jgi:hypothetical protein
MTDRYLAQIRVNRIAERCNRRYFESIWIDVDGQELGEVEKMFKNIGNAFNLHFQTVDEPGTKEYIVIPKAILDDCIITLEVQPQQGEPDA